MRRLFDIAKWGLTLGREPQSFLSAKWVERVLDRSAESKKRIWALRLLSLSPHYFIDPDAPEYKGMKTDKYLEKVFQVCLDSRIKIYDQVLKGRFQNKDAVLDYGCGPGFWPEQLRRTYGKYTHVIYRRAPLRARGFSTMLRISNTLSPTAMV